MKHEPTTYEMGGDMWGDSIAWWPDFASRCVAGWKYRRPQKGDLLRVPMRSGKVLLCKFVEVRYMRDPDDQFFGRVKDLGYEGELPPPAWYARVWARLTGWLA